MICFDPVPNPGFYPWLPEDNLKTGLAAAQEAKGLLKSQVRHISHKKPGQKMTLWNTCVLY